MVTLDRVMDLQNRGVPESDIIRTLRDEGISPQEINDSLNQAKVKTAVSQEMDQEMQQSSMPEEQYPMQGDMQQGMQDQVPQADQSYYQDQGYSGYGQQYYEQPAMSTDVIAEVAEQIVAEKFDEFKKKTGDLISFQNRVNEQLKDLNDRLKVIESAIENLQKAVIQKIGEFGETSAYIHKDLENVHDTMSKLMNPLIDNYQELKNHKRR